MNKPDPAPVLTAVDDNDDIKGVDDIKKKEIYSQMKKIKVDFKRFYGIEPIRVNRHFVITLSAHSYLPKVFLNLILIIINSMKSYQQGSNSKLIDWQSSRWLGSYRCTQCFSCISIWRLQWRPSFCDYRHRVGHRCYCGAWHLSVLIEYSHDWLAWGSTQGCQSECAIRYRESWW